MSSDRDSDAETGDNSETSSKPEVSSESYLRDTLNTHLGGILYAGSFAASKSSQKYVDPGLQINGVGSISLLLRVQDAKAIAKIGKQAPFGRGTAIVVDKSFRNTIELSVEQFQIRNPASSKEMTDIITLLGRDLGFPYSPLGMTAELYKMLLYEEGAFFKPHKEYHSP